MVCGVGLVLGDIDLFIGSKSFSLGGIYIIYILE